MESKRERKIGGEKAHKTEEREKGGKAAEHKMAETHVHVHHHHHHHGAAEGMKKAPAKKK